MTIAKPPLPPVSPGQPITAQAWNGVLTAVGNLYDAVNGFGSETVSVSVIGAGQALVGAVVVAVPANGPPVIAVPPLGAATTHTLTNMKPGAWNVIAGATGFATVTQPLTVPASGTVTINLTANTAVMPNILGMTTANALAALNGAGIQTDLILDIYGGEVSKVAIPTNRAGSRVLSQFPLPGTRVIAASAATRFTVSAPAEGTKEKESLEKNEALDKSINDKVKDTDKGLEKIAEKAPEKTIEKNDKNLILEKAISDKIKDTDVLPAVGPDGGMSVFIPADERPAVGERVLSEELDG